MLETAGPAIDRISIAVLRPQKLTLPQRQPLPLPLNQADREHLNIRMQILLIPAQTPGQGEDAVGRFISDGTLMAGLSDDLM